VRFGRDAGALMPAAHFLLVERESADVFQITWWDYTGAKRIERASPEQLTRRCQVLTDPERLTVVPPGVHESIKSKNLGHVEMMDGPRC
jgi:hypothetical protein